MSCKKYAFSLLEILFSIALASIALGTIFAYYGHLIKTTLKTQTEVTNMLGMWYSSDTLLTSIKPKDSFHKIEKNGRKASGQYATEEHVLLESLIEDNAIKLVFNFAEPKTKEKNESTAFNSKNHD